MGLEGGLKGEVGVATSATQPVPAARGIVLVAHQLILDGFSNGMMEIYITILKYTQSTVMSTYPQGS